MRILNNIRRRASALLWRQALRRPKTLLLLAGLLMAAAFPPVPAPLLLVPAFAILLVVIEARYVERRPRRAYGRLFGLTYLCFFVWNLLTCYWLMLTALSVPETSEAIAAAVAGFLANALNPILMSIPVLAYLFVRRRLPREVAVGAFVVFWLAFEHLHLNWDLTWSWVTLGHAYSSWPLYIQFIEWTGVGGASLLTLVGSGLLFLALAEKWRSRPAKRLTLAFIVWLLLPLLLNVYLLQPSRAVFQPSGELRVRVVQPNVDPYRKFDYDELQRIPAEMARLAAPGLDTIDLVVLPETALPIGVWDYELQDNSQILPLAALTKRYGASVLTGLVYRRIIKSGEGLPASARRYDDNTGIYFDSYNAATVVGLPRVYYKGKLVPLTERTPFLESLSFMGDVGIDLGGGFLSFGLPTGPDILFTHQGVGIAPVICYESQFGEFVAQNVKLGAGLICVITNDGWFGRSSGHVQHAALATLRAIETRRCVARSANTGLSLFLDNCGQTLGPTLTWWRKGVIDRTLPLYNSETLYMYAGDYIGRAAVWLTLLAFVLAAAGALIRRSRRG